MNSDKKSVTNFRATSNVGKLGNGYKLNKKRIAAAIATFGLFVGALFGIGAAINNNNNSQESSSISYEDYQQILDDQPKETFTANADDLAQYNVVLVKDDVSDRVFDHVATYLEDVGIPVRIVESSEELNNLDGSDTIIGLMDLKTAKNGDTVKNDDTVKVIAPNDNDHYNRSDPLAIAMRNSITHSVIQSGVYNIDATGITKLTQSKLEKHMNADIPFVTLAISSDMSEEALANTVEEIVDALVRLHEYTKYAGDIGNYDLLYRVTAGDTVYSLEQKFPPSDIPHDTILPVDSSLVMETEIEGTPLDPDTLEVNIAEPVAGKTY